MSNLVDTTEMYLRTILDLEEEDITPLRARISERLGHSGPTVSQTIARMERDGLVEVAPDRRLVLTTTGREKAIRVLRKHRIAESLLANVIGLDLAIVHDEACRWEHVMSDEAEERIYKLLGEPTESPYGTPIPSEVDCGLQPDVEFFRGVASLDQAEISSGDVAEVRRLGEPLQADLESMRMFREQGVLPGSRVVVEYLGDDIRLSPVGGSTKVDVPIQLARHVYITAE
ncbi:metal-dependent transcriptional regulator [Gulosibacter sp. ACHW.36C]|uniref:Metal-dependent transcriptional regulator n=1 Tax=Gulosibacter sediminis TaxID=1729695 RepID=A0ABY4N1B2_9MICO|nr:metal-dependent transcriptional regulator [Gulosibacter sediminis]UQN16077.1 metal-dependent transcriptional regulator [Gulosibacter sediminis]